MKAIEITDMQTQTKDHPGLPETRRGKDRLSPRAFGGAGDPADTMILGFRSQEL